MLRVLEAVFIFMSLLDFHLSQVLILVNGKNLWVYFWWCCATRLMLFLVGSNQDIPPSKTKRCSKNHISTMRYYLMQKQSVALVNWSSQLDLNIVPCVEYALKSLIITAFGLISALDVVTIDFSWCSCYLMLFNVHMEEFVEHWYS